MVDRSQCVQKLRFLFFTGGTALRRLSLAYARAGEESFHLVTTFDSGGSTAELRRVFAIPAMGDMRNRLIALADPSLSPAISSFLQMRLSPEVPNTSHLTALRQRTNPSDPFWSKTDPARVHFLTEHLATFLEKAPSNFDFRGSCLGNCILAELFLRSQRDFSPTMDALHSLLRIRGRVLPIVDCSLHLGCELSDGEFFVGQHLCKANRQRIRRIFLTASEPFDWKKSEPVSLPELLEGACYPPVARAAKEALSLCDVICYPMGSFYSSVLVNLLASGVGETIARRSCPKIFIPNVGFDPELINCSIVDQCRKILGVLQKDAPFVEARDLITTVLIDAKNGDYQGRLSSDTREWLVYRGIDLLDLPLCREPNLHDPALTDAALKNCYAHWSEGYG